MTSTSPLVIPVVSAVLAFLASACAVGGAPLADHGPAGAPERPARSATVPFTLDHNRMILEVELARPDGTLRRASAWMDTGTEALIVTEELARDLALDLSNLDGEQGRHSVETSSPAPGIRIGGLALDVEGIPTRVKAGLRVMPGVPAEVHLPASALRREHAVFDYPARRLTIASPGVLEPRGTAIPCRVNPDTGLVMVTAAVDGEPVPLGLDNGSSGTWVSTALTDALRARNPGWRHVAGALGSANFWGFDFERAGVLLRLPVLELGPIQVRDVALLGLGQELFDWYSKKSAAPVVGFLGANVLGRFRLEVDFANQLTYWEGAVEPAVRDLDIVGLTIRPEHDGGYAVAGVVEVDGASTVVGPEPGDRLVAVGALATAGATMGQVIDALRGEPGATRVLELERRGERLTVEARVTRFP